MDIKLRLEGYAEQTRTLSTDKDQSVDVTLAKAPSGTPTATPPPVKTPPVAQAPTSPPNQPTQPTQEDPSASPDKPVKPAKSSHHHRKGKGKTDADGVLPLSF